MADKFYKNTDIALTPWQQECETKIVRNGLNELEAALLRRVYELTHHISSIQHWAGNRYSQYLLDTAQETVNTIPMNEPLDDSHADQQYPTR